MRVWLLLCACLLCFGALFTPVVARAINASEPPGSGSGSGSYVSDYQAVRKVGLALAVAGFLLGVARLSNTEMPHERHRAQRLIMMALTVFLLLVGDRMLAQGVSSWFQIDRSSLPVFWQ